jgi:hypothetical protein
MPLKAGGALFGFNALIKNKRASGRRKKLDDLNDLTRWSRADGPRSVP